MAVTTSLREAKIVAAKTLLDEARMIYEHSPSVEIERVVNNCEAEMNALLEQYPTERGTP